MEPPSSLLSVDQFLCLDVFNEPVSTACGHNFCMVCVSRYWDTTDLCQCPLCKQAFYRIPELKLITAFRDLLDHFKKMRDRDQSPTEPG